MSPVSLGTSQLPSPKKTGVAKLWLILIGVNHYQDAQLPNLRYSVMDCQGLSEALQEALQGTEKMLTVHHDGMAQPPTLKTVQASLANITANAQAQDTVLLYFSGHGVQDPNSQQAVLCLADTQKEQLLETGLSLQGILQDLSQCPAQQQLVWLDACHSGGMTLRGTEASGTEINRSQTNRKTTLPNPTSQFVSVLRERAAKSSGFYALLSCDQDQRSWEFPQLGHGVFTYYLMRGLRGEAANGQGAISADSLYRYVYYQTLRYIDKTNQQLRLINQQKRSKAESSLQSEYPLQTPKRIVEGVGENVLVQKVPESEYRYPRQAILIDGMCNSSSSLALGKLFRRAGDFELAYWPQPNASWTDVRGAIQDCLKASGVGERAASALESATALLYLRGTTQVTPTGEPVLVLPEGTLVSRSWLRQTLRQSGVAQQIVILDCPGATDLAEWVEDLQLGSGSDSARASETQAFQIQGWGTAAVEQSGALPGGGQMGEQIGGFSGGLTGGLTGGFSGGLTGDLTGGLLPGPLKGQCVLAAAAPLSDPDAFAQALLDTLSEADERAGLPVAGWITQLQGRLAIADLSPHFWLSGAQGVIEVIPGQSALRQTDRAGGDIGLCPYRGLRAFEAGDAAFFFGRTALVQRLLREVNGQSFLAVVGASGSGKSSVVQAGLMAQLRQGKQIPGSQHWWVNSFRPGAHPLQALAKRLMDVGKEGDSKEQLQKEQLQIEGLLHLGPEGLVQWLRSRPEPMVVLVVDQFEELFTLASDQERQQFLALMLGAMEHARDRFKLVITLRADFMSACLEDAELAQKLQRSSVLVPPVLSPEDYRQIILRPAENVGLRVEPELVSVLLKDLSQGVGDLPLLEFVLEQIWEKRQPGQLSLQVYQQQVGGLQGALERKAQAVYEALSEEEQACARWIFLNLTQLGEGTEDTRRRLSKAELVVRKYPEVLVDRTLKALTTAKLVVVTSTALSQPEASATARGIDDFDKARPSSLGRVLLDAPDGALMPEVTVEVAHEILIRHWSTLRWWLEENRTRLRSQRQVEQAALAWKQNNKQADFLLRGLPLDAAVELYVQYTDELSQDVQTFVETGLAARDAEQAKTQQALKRAQRAIALISTLAVGVAGFGGAAYLQRQQARFREVEALNALSTAQLSNHQALEATVTAVKAGELLQAIRGRRFLDSFWGADALVAQTTGTLQQAVSLGAERNRLEGHSEQVRAIAYSPNGESLASVSDDGTLKVWQADGSQARSVVVDAHPENPRLNSRALDVAYSPDGGLIAVAQSNGEVTLWPAGDAGDQESVVPRKIAAHSDWVTAVAFHPEGGGIATAGRDGAIKLWAVADGQLLKTFRGHKGWVNSISWSPDGQRLVSGGEDQRIRLWDVASGQSVWERVGHGQRVASVAFSEDGQWVASGGGDRTVKLWGMKDLAGKTSVQIIGDHDDQVNDVAFSADGKSLLSVGADRHVKVWRVEEGAPIADFQGHGGEVLAAAWRPNGRSDKQQIASSSRDNTVRLWQVPLAEPVSPALSSVQFSPDGTLLAGATWDGGIELWQREGSQWGKQLTALGEKNRAEEDSHIAQIAFSPNQQQLAAAHEGGKIRLWNWMDKTAVSLLSGNADAITAVAFSPSGKWLLSGGEDRTLRLWNPVDGREQQRWDAHEDGVSAIAWHPRNRLMASGSYDKTVKIWDRSGNLQRTLAGHGEAIAALTFTPDGKYLASSAWDNTLKIWRVRDGNLIRTLSGHQNGVTGLAFFPKGEVLVSGSADATLKLWNFHTGELLNTLQGHQQAVDSLSLSADGTLLMSNGDNLEVQRWEWTLAEILAKGCRQLDNYLLTNPNVQETTICETTGA